MQDILFFNYNQIASPRIHDDINYQNFIQLRIEQMIRSKFFKNANLVALEQTNYKKYKSKKGFHRSITKPINEMCISSSIQSIGFTQTKEKPRLSISPKKGNINSSKNLLRFSSKIPSNSRQTFFAGTLPRINLDNAERYTSIASNSDVEYDPSDNPFKPTRIFGYRCVNLRRLEGTFEIFEPAIKTEIANDQNFINRHRLSSRSVSEIYEDSSVDSSEQRDIVGRDNHDFTSQKSRNYQMIPIKPSLERQNKSMNATFNPKAPNNPFMLNPNSNQISLRHSSTINPDMSSPSNSWHVVEKSPKSSTVEISRYRWMCTPEKRQKSKLATKHTIASAHANIYDEGDIASISSDLDTISEQKESKRVDEQPPSQNIKKKLVYLNKLRRSSVLKNTLLGRILNLKQTSGFDFVDQEKLFSRLASQNSRRKLSNGSSLEMHKQSFRELIDDAHSSDLDQNWLDNNSYE